MKGEVIVKKVLKIVAIVLLVVIILIGIALALNWKYVSALVVGLTTDEEKLGQQRVDNTVASLSSINDHMNGELREITEEEKEAIQSGELSQTAVMAQIIAEAAGIELPDLSEFDENGDLIAAAADGSGAGTDSEQAGSQGQAGTSAGNKPENQPGAAGGNTGSTTAGGKGGATSTKPSSEGQAASQPAASYDQIVAATVTKLYGLQGQYTGQINGLVGRVKAEYNKIKKESGAATAKSSVMSKYAGEVAAMENSCDAKVEGVLSDLTSQLKAIGADTSIVGELRSAYVAEKKNQRAAYANRYMK